LNFNKIFPWLLLIIFSTACGVKNAPRSLKAPEFKSWQDEIIQQNILKEEFSEEELQDNR